jgi:hypothetical protein
MKMISVKPKSGRAKNRFANTLKKNPVCIIDQDTPTMLLLKGQDQDYWFWIQKQNDPHWEII